MSNLNSPVNQETTKTTSETNASFLRAARAGNLEKVLEYLEKESIDINVSNSNGLNALHLASKEGHVHVVDELLKQKADVNAATKKGNTALHIASLAGQQAVVELLVKNGANVDCRSQNGFTPLYMAAQENHLEVVRFLLANNANQSLATEDGFTPLAVALQQGHEKVVAILLENDSRGKIRLPALHIAAKKNDVKAAALLLSNDPNMDLSPEAGKSGFTPLHIAAHYGNVEIAKYLISKGANVNYEARQNITPLHVATKWGKANSVNLLLENGAKIDAKTRDGLTPLHCAARSGHEEVVELLITKQGPINAKTKNGLTSLHMAAQGDHVEAARILLYHSPKLVDQTTCDFLTALHVAAHCGHVKIAKLLIDHKADVNSRALNGFTPLHIACKKNRIKVIELLIKHGASKEATTESGLTPLHVASFMGCMNVVVFLIQHGSLPNVPTIRGETPLHLAARANQTDIVRILLRHGASVDAKAKESQTPLHIATRLGNTDIIALLLRHGAYVDAPTSDGYTPLHIASKEGQEEVASILFENGASLNVTTKKGFTPLHIAAKYGNIKVASLLLQREAQPDIQGKNGLTPLHVATHYNRPSLAHLLLQHNASPHIVAKNGYSALHIAAKKNQLDIATTLLEYNAKTNCESNAGFTPLHLACQEGHLDMASLLLDHKAEPGAASKNGLTPLHLCAQEDKVNCAAVLVKMNATIDPQTKAGYTPLHVACHFGQINMVKFLLGHMADVNIITKKHGFTALHCAAQQGHVLIVKLLLEHGASPDITNNNGQTPLAIAQRLGYISVIEELRQVTQTTLVSTTIKTTEEKYKVQTPETMQETFMSDSEDEMGDEAMFGDAEHYKYLTNEADLNTAADDSIALTPKTPKRDDSKPASPQTPNLNVELALAAHQDENHINEHELRPESPKAQKSKSQPDSKFIANSLGNMSMAESMDGSFYNGYASSKNVNLLNETDNIPIESKPKSTGKLEWKFFLISFMVDARGGAMKGCRHSGVRVIIPPKRASMPTRITCRFVRKEKLSVGPPLNESESLAARVLEMGPQGCKFLGPVVLEIPHYASLRGREREIVILRSDAGEKWYEHPISASESAVEEALGCTLELLTAQNHESDAMSQQNHEDNVSQVSANNRIRITRIITHDFPKYFALVSRVRHETHAVSEIGGVISSTIVPKAQAVFPEKALQKKIKLSLQAMPIAHELVSKMFGNRVVVSPIVTIEPRRRKFHKAITLTIPLPKSPYKGMINNYSHNNDSYSLRLLCSITGGLAPAQWEDITGHTPLSYIDECVSFTTTVSARFWLMDCQNVAEATKMATELYREAIAVPFMARFVVYSKRHDYNEAKLRVYCITDDKEEKTLEQREGFLVVAKSKEVEVLDNRVQWLEMSGNIAPISLNKSNVNCSISGASEQLNMTFMSFYENRLPFTIRIKDAEQNPINGRLVFLKDSRNVLSKLDSATRAAPVCTLDIQLPNYNREKIELDESKKRATLERGQLNLKTILNDSSATLLSQASSNRPSNVTEFNLRLLANDLSNLVENFDWIHLAKLLELTDQDIDLLKHSSSNSPNLLSASLANQAHDMLVYFENKHKKEEHDEHAASYGQILSKALQQMGVEADIIERNSYMISGILPQSTENIFSVEKSLHNKLNEHQLDSKDESQLESSINQLKEAVNLYTSHEDRDIMKESESAEISENENEQDLVDNVSRDNQIELNSLINQIDKQMDELGRDNQNDDEIVSTVIVGEEHLDRKENGFVSKTIIDAVVQGISDNQFDNYKQHVEETTQITTLVEDKQDTIDHEDLIQETETNQQNELEEVEQAIHADDDYYDYDSYEADAEKKNLIDEKSTYDEEIFIKLDRSQLREFDFSSYDCNSSEASKFQDIEQQSPIIEQELLTTEQQLENFKQKLSMSESVSDLTQTVLDSIRKEYSLGEKIDDGDDNENNAYEVETTQPIDPLVQQVIENLTKESENEMQKVIMVEPIENEVVYDSDLDELGELVKNENEDEKDCLLETSSSEMSSLKNKLITEHCDNQDTEQDQDPTWFTSEQNESQSLVENLSLSKQYQTFESSSSSLSSIKDDLDSKEKFVLDESGTNNNVVSIVIQGSNSSTADESETKFDKSNLHIELIKVSESREHLIENDHLQRDESSYNICSYTNDQVVTIGHSIEDISAATTVIEQQRFMPDCQTFYVSSEADVTDDENNRIELKESQMHLDIPALDTINQSESTEPLILGKHLNQELTSNSSASVNSVNSSTNSSHYSLTTSDENMAKNLLDNENNDLSKSSSSSIDTEDLNRKNISKSLNFLESLVVPSYIDPNEQIEEYTILLERQNELNKAELAERDLIKCSNAQLSPMKTSQSLNLDTKSICKQVVLNRPNEIDLFSTNYQNEQYEKALYEHQTPTPIENTSGYFFDKRITSSNEPSMDLLDKTSSVDNSEKTEFNVDDLVVDSLINQISDPEHAEEEVAAAFATAYLFSSNVNSQSNEEIKSQISSAMDDELLEENRFAGIDNEAYASSKSSRESVIINFDYDDSDDQHQMKIKIIQSNNPLQSLVCSSYDPELLIQSNEEFVSTQAQIQSNNDLENLINDSSIENDYLIDNELNVNDDMLNQDKEPLITDEYVEIFEEKILPDDDIVIISSNDNQISSTERDQKNGSKENLVTKDGVILDDQSFLISTPVNELNSQIAAVDDQQLEQIKYSQVAKELVQETLNKSIEKVLNEIATEQIGSDNNLDSSKKDFGTNDELEETRPVCQLELTDNNKEEMFNSESLVVTNVLDECQSEKGSASEACNESYCGAMVTPIVVFEHVASESNSDQEFDPDQLIENSSSHESTIDLDERHANQIAQQIVEKIITKSIEKLNELTDSGSNQSIIKTKSDSDNRFGQKEVRFSTSKTLHEEKCGDCFDNQLSTLQQLIVNSNFENTFNQINKMNSQNSESQDSCIELERIIEDRWEDEHIDGSNDFESKILVEAKNLCEFVIESAVKSLNESSEKSTITDNEQNTIDEEEKFEKKFNENFSQKIDEIENDRSEIASKIDELISEENKSFDLVSENDLLEDMKKPLLTSSFMSDTLPSDNETDQASYHTAVTGLNEFNESKQNYSSSNYLTAHDDQESNSQQLITASDSFYSANSKLKSLDSSLLSSFSNMNNSYNNLDESYSTLNETINCSDFEQTLVNETNDESKYEDVHSFIKDMQPLIASNLEAKGNQEEISKNEQCPMSPKHDSNPSASSSASSVDIKCLGANTAPTSTSSSSPLQLSNRPDLGDNASCTSSILEFEKIEEQCMEATDDALVQIEQKDDFRYDSYFFEQTAILTNDLNTIYETNEKESSSSTSSPLAKSQLKLDSNEFKKESIAGKSDRTSPNEIDLSIDLSKQKTKNQSASANTSPMQSPTCGRPKNIGSTSSLTKQVLQLQQLSTSRSSSSSSIKSTDSFENELKTKVKIDENSYFAKVRQNTPPLLENKNENSELLDANCGIRKKSSKRTSRTSSSTSSTSSHGDNSSTKISTLNSSLGAEACNMSSANSINTKQSILTAEDLPSFKKSTLINCDQNSAKVTSSASSSNISSDPSKVGLNQTLSQSTNFEQKNEIHRSSSTHSHHSSDCYCGKSSPTLTLSTNMPNTINPTSSSSCFSFTTESKDLQPNVDQKQLDVNVPSDSTSS